MDTNIKVFVSGCYDVLHAGHTYFFQEAKKHGTHLTVCFASKEVLKLAKGRISSVPDEYKKKLLESIKGVDAVVSSSDEDAVFDFITHLKTGDYKILAVTDDDKNRETKEEICDGLGLEMVVIPKNKSLTLSTTKILAVLKDRIKVPLRVDFGGGWLDVPKFAQEGTYIVNCTITPMVSLEAWPYEIGSGLGGSAALSMLKVRNGVMDELDKGVGWQDPAVIHETGLCVWRSGEKPILHAKINPDFLQGHMALYWTGSSHDNANIVDNERDYKTIAQAGKEAKWGAESHSIDLIAEAMKLSYKAQLAEGMEKLPDMGEMAKKYCGGGWGGYALYLFEGQRPEGLIHIEPYIK